VLPDDVWMFGGVAARQKFLPPDAKSVIFMLADAAVVGSSGQLPETLRQRNAAASFPDPTFGGLSDAAAVDRLMTFSDGLDPEAILLLEIGLLEDKSILLPGYDGQVITARISSRTVRMVRPLSWTRRGRRRGSGRIAVPIPICLAFIRAHFVLQGRQEFLRRVLMRFNS
jgi:hypothetical protein